MTNAIKFSPEKGKVQILCLIVLQDSKNSVVEIRVRDEGIGLSQEDQQNMFDPLYQKTQGLSALDKKSGIGIGLHVSNLVAKCLGGQISVQSILGTGTTMTFKFTSDDTRKEPLLRSGPAPSPPKKEKKEAHYKKMVKKMYKSQQRESQTSQQSQLEPIAQTSEESQSEEMSMDEKSWFEEKSATTSQVDLKIDQPLILVVDDGAPSC